MPKGSNAEKDKKGFQVKPLNKIKAPTVASIPVTSAIPTVAFSVEDSTEVVDHLSNTYQKFKANQKMFRDKWLDREIDIVNRLINDADNDNNYDNVVGYIRFTSAPGHTPDHDSLLESQSNGEYEFLQSEARSLAYKIDKDHGIKYEGNIPSDWDYDAYASLRALRTTDDLELIDMIVASTYFEYIKELGFNPNLTREHLETILSNPIFAKSMWTLLSNPLITKDFAKTFIQDCQSPALLLYLARDEKYIHLGTEALELARKRAGELRKKQ